MPMDFAPTVYRIPKPQSWRGQTRRVKEGIWDGTPLFYTSAEWDRRKKARKLARHNRIRNAA